MAEPFEAATTKIATSVAEFVEAADRLVNLLTEDMGDASDVVAFQHKADVEVAMNRYDVARRVLTGDDVSNA